MATGFNRRAERWQITAEAKTSILLKTVRYKIFSFGSSVGNNWGRVDKLQKRFGKILNLSKTGPLMNLTTNYNVMV